MMYFYDISAVASWCCTSLAAFVWIWDGAVEGLFERLQKKELRWFHMQIILKNESAVCFGFLGYCFLVWVGVWWGFFSRLLIWVVFRGDFLWVFCFVVRVFFWVRQAMVSLWIPYGAISWCFACTVQLIILNDLLSTFEHNSQKLNSLSK